MGIYLVPFTMLSFNSDSKIVLIKEEAGEAPKRNNTKQVKPYFEYSEKSKSTLSHP